ncbi:MAG TPA: hypothetical protein VFM88_21315 [Vicinamibacteria bacterium]|nr:hypothetical protein [Vicinamibacteria bacterium]
MAGSKSPRPYPSRFALTHGVLDLDDLLLDEMLAASDLDGDPLLAPWRRGHRAAIRSAFSH